MSEEWRFRLFIAGRTPLGQRALANLEALVEEHFPDGAPIEVVDLEEDPRKAVEARIMAVPTAVRVRPEPEARVIGDLSNSDEVRRALELPPAP